MLTGGSNVLFLVCISLATLSYGHESNQLVRQKILSELKLKYPGSQDRTLNRKLFSETIELQQSASFLYYTGAIYRYYESRRRLHNDAQPSRLVQVKENESKARRRQSQRNVSPNHVVSYFVDIASFMILCLILYCSSLRDAANT